MLCLLWKRERDVLWGEKIENVIDFTSCFFILGGASFLYLLNYIINTLLRTLAKDLSKIQLILFISNRHTPKSLPKSIMSQQLSSNSSLLWQLDLCYILGFNFFSMKVDCLRTLRLVISGNCKIITRKCEIKDNGDC